MALAAARQDGVEGLVVPAANGWEAAVVEDVQVVPVGSLAEAAAIACCRGFRGSSAHR
jgi:magnesium chelatase family protein